MTATAAYSQKSNLDHRKAFGQFFTNPDVARFMVDWVLESGIPSVFDPAYGLGAFDVCDEHIHFTASEIDASILHHASRIQPGRSSHVRCEDYLASWGQRHSNIVCNPPYMRFQKFLNRDQVSAAFQEHLGLRMSGYTNTASAFLLKSLAELDGRGRLAYIMPLEFLNTGYGTIIKDRLMKGRHLQAIISLQCEKDVFPDATTSVGIILYDAAKTHTHVDFHQLHEIEKLSDLAAQTPVSRISYSSLKAEDKWQNHFQPPLTLLLDTTGYVPLSTYGKFSRGIATGANEFFMLSASRVAELGLEPHEVKQCISRSSQIRQSIFTQDDFTRLAADDAPVYLFSVEGTPSAAAADYIRYGESMGYHQRFLTSKRNPWYRTEHRQPCPILLGVFSRGGYKVVLNQSKARNLTCYHGFTPNLFGAAHIRQIFDYLDSDHGREIVARSMRKYGDALDKFEPGDLNSIYIKLCH